MDATHLRLQALLHEGSDPSEDLRAAARGQWAELQRQRVPQPSLAHPFARHQWSGALAAGQAWKAERRELDAHLVAVWSPERRPGAALLAGPYSRVLADAPMGVPLDAHYAIRLLIQPVLHLVPAGGEPSVLRSFGAYELVERHVLQLIAINDRYPIDGSDMAPGSGGGILPRGPLPVGLHEPLRALDHD